MNLGDIYMEFGDNWMILGILYWKYMIIIDIFRGEYYYGDLIKHYCKVHLVHWIGKKDHQEKKRKIRNKIKRCKLCLPC